MQDLLQILQLLTALNPAEVFLGPKQRGSCPAQNHSWSVPAFDSTGPVRGLGKTILAEIRVGQSPAERMADAKSLNRQGFFQTFQQAGGPHGRKVIHPAGSFAQFFLGKLRVFLTPSRSHSLV